MQGMADETLDSRRHAVLAGASRAAVLDLLRRSEHPLGVAEVAEAVGLHANTVRTHLDLLVETGYAARDTEAPRGPGRPRVVYRATATNDDGRNYRLLAELLARYLVATNEHPGEAAIAAGRHWAKNVPLRLPDGWGGDDLTGEGASGANGSSGEGARAARGADGMARVLHMLADAGFAPEMGEDGSSIYLHSCPFRELAQSQRDVVCGAHLGIIQGALAEVDAHVQAPALLPFVEPDLCVASLTRTDEQPAQGR
jgi:predicted ArsR family transcriptional regulator